MRESERGRGKGDRVRGEERMREGDRVRAREKESE